MRLRTTIALVILTAGLAWFVAQEDFARPQAGAAAANLRLFSFKKQQADTIEISGKDQAVILQRRGDDWRITAPVEDRANPLLAEAILEILVRMENIQTLDPGTFSSDLVRRAGLNGASIQLNISGGGTKLATCKVGARTALENSVYISLPHPKKGDRIHAARLPFAELGKSEGPAAKKFDFLGMLHTPAEGWRDPALIRLKADNVRRITLSAGTGLMEFRRDTGRVWELTKPLQTRASEERINALLAALLHIEARPAEKVQATAASALPGMKLSIEATGRSLPVEVSLQPGADPDAEILATVSDRPGSFVLPGKAAAVWKLQPNDLREPHLAAIDPAAVTAVRIRDAMRPEVVLNKQGEMWMLTRFGKTEPANQERISRLFSELNTTQIREFASDAPTNLEPFGLHQPFLELEWAERGKRNTLQFAVSAENRIYCRYTHEPFVYRINPSVLSAIPADGVKWQGLGILNLSSLALRRIVIAEGDSPALTLQYDPQSNAWKGEIAGKDVTAQIQTDKANALLNKLVNFTAETWVTDRTAGYEALKKPCLTVRILVLNPSAPEAAPVPHTLLFASTNPAQPSAAYYGRLDTNPDLFLISHEQYREIVSPVIK